MELRQRVKDIIKLLKTERFHQNIFILMFLLTVGYFAFSFFGTLYIGLNVKFLLADTFMIFLVGTYLGYLLFFTRPLSEQKHSHKKQIKNPPFSFLLKISEALPKKYAKDLTQNVSDMRLEYYEAVAEGRIWRPKTIIASYYVGLTWSIASWVISKVRELIKPNAKTTDT